MTGGERGESAVATATVEDLDGVTYLGAEDAVRYVAGWRAATDGASAERKPRTKTVPFERWAATRCGRPVRERTLALVTERLDGNAACLSAAVGADGGVFPHRTVTVALRTTLDRAGRVRFAPTVEYGAVRTVTPSAVAVTVRLDGHEYVEAVPVYLTSSPP